jgi:spore germination protein (amino acid permease)
VQNVVKENHMISGAFVFFLIQAAQTGVSVLNFQNLIVEGAGQDAWIAVILMGSSLHLIIWMVYKMLGYPAKDVIDLQRTIFGSFLGNILSLLMVGYFFMIALEVLRSYIEIIQAWVFPSLQTWELAVILISIIYYLVSGGFRILTGFSFLAVVLSTTVLLTVYQPLQHIQLRNLLPAFDHSFQDLVKASKSSSLIYTGFATLLIYFPFLKSPEKNVKWAHFAVLFSTLKHVILMVVTLLYFNQGLLKHTLWPTLVMAKIIEFSFLARFEFIFIFLWLMVIVPAVCIPIWCCTRILKKITTLKPRLFLLLILLALFIAALNLKDTLEIDIYRNFVSGLGFYLVYGYIPFLFIIDVIRTRLNRL